MLLNVLAKAGVTGASCAGFDGYSCHGENYFNAAMDYRIAREKSLGINRYVQTILKQLEGTLTLTFITDSYYTE